MKTSDLKETLKPLIKQCIKEVIFEDGVLSGIITEIVKGLDTRTMVVEAKEPPPPPAPSEDPARRAAIDRARREHRQEMEQQRRSLSESLGGRLNGVDIFEGVNAIEKAGSPGGSAGAPSSPLQGIAPNDPGVDITKLGIFGKGR